MLIDTHMHFENDDIEKYIENATNNGVNIMIIGGTSKEENEESIKLINKYKELYLTIGFHPEFCDVVTDKNLDEMVNYIKSNKKIVGLGEIGIDFHYGKENEKKQIDLFRKQLHIAEELHLPVVIHTRDAIEKTYEILKEYKVKGIIHCFSGSYEMAKKFIDLGFYLGIGGVATFKNSNLKDVLKKIKPDNILFETDSPYLSPFRGQKNESSNIKYICEYVSNIMGISFEELSEITTKNAHNLFDFGKAI